MSSLQIEGGVDTTLGLWLCQRRCELGVVAPWRGVSVYLEKTRHVLSETKSSLNLAQDTRAVPGFFLVFDLPLNGEGVVSVRDLEDCEKIPWTRPSGVSSATNDGAVVLPESTR